MHSFTSLQGRSLIFTTYCGDLKVQYVRSNPQELLLDVQFLRLNAHEFSLETQHLRRNAQDYSIKAAENISFKTQHLRQNAKEFTFEQLRYLPSNIEHMITANEYEKSRTPTLQLQFNRRPFHYTFARESLCTKNYRGSMLRFDTYVSMPERSRQRLYVYGCLHQLLYSGFYAQDLLVQKYQRQGSFPKAI